MYCADDEDIILHGTLDLATHKKDHSYVKYDIFRCSEETRDKTVDPECASPEEITAWTQNKMAYFKVLNTKANFKKGDEEHYYR